MESSFNADLSGVRLDSQISVKVARTALDAQEQQGEAAVQLLESAVETAKSTQQQNTAGSGRVDVYG